MTEPVIQIKNVVVSYRHSVALRGVSLKVARGEFIGLIGPNGAGKTTLLTVVNGLAHVLEGDIQVLGRDVNSRARHELRKYVGYVAQAANIEKRMPVSAREVVMIGRYGRLGLFHRPSRHDWELVDAALEMVGMAHLSQRPIGHLSGGEQQRIAIARCLAQEPDIFLLDEPTASLDWKAQTEILELVKQIHKERHLTTLFVTHNIDTLPHAFDRVVMMKDGHIIGDGPPEELVTTARVSELYNLPPDVVSARRFHVHTGEHHDGA
jgi:ABC-type Mn2+/Zn2+ transport system ATPase subunit